MNPERWPAIALLASLGLLALLVVGAAVPWMADMRHQPSVGPQQTIVALPDGSVPVGRTDPTVRPADAAELVVMRVEAGRIPNPLAPDADSLARGRVVYEIHCQVCHGAEGRGDGPVGKIYLPPPMDLTLPYVQQQADGQIFYTITHGSVVMPWFYDAIPVDDRWHAVNYIRHVIGTP